MSQALRRIAGSKDKKGKKDLSTVGIFTIADQKIKERLIEYKALDGFIKACLILPETKSVRRTIAKGERKGQEVETLQHLSPEEKIQLVLDNIQKINGKLYEISVPWGRGGSEKWYAEAMIAWSTLSTLFINIAVGVSEYLKHMASQTSDPLRSKNEAVSKLHTVIVNVFIKYAQIVYSISWYKDDVANAWALTLYQPPMPTGARIGFDDLQKRHEQEEPGEP